MHASLELGMELGEDGLTMRGIAARLNVSATALYQHYDGKGAILLDIRKHGYDLLWQAVEPLLATASPLERLERVCACYVRFCRDHPWLYSVMVRYDAASQAAALGQGRSAPRQGSVPAASEASRSNSSGTLGAPAVGPAGAGVTSSHGHLSGAVGANPFESAMPGAGADAGAGTGPGTGPGLMAGAVAGSGYAGSNSHHPQAGPGNDEDAGSGSTEPGDRSLSVLRACSECIRAAITAGESPSELKPDSVALQLWAACHGLCSLLLNHSQSVARAPSDSTASHNVEFAAAPAPQSNAQDHAHSGQGGSQLPADVDGFIDDFVHSIVRAFAKPTQA